MPGSGKNEKTTSPHSGSHFSESECEDGGQVTDRRRGLSQGSAAAWGPRMLEAALSPERRAVRPHRNAPHRCSYPPTGKDDLPPSGAGSPPGSSPPTTPV